MSVFYCKNCGCKENTNTMQRKNYGARTLIITGYDGYKYLCNCPKCNYQYAVFFVSGWLEDKGMEQYIEWYVTNYIKDLIEEGK